MSDLGFLLDGCDEGERIARLRELRVLVAVYCGWSHPAKMALDQALAGGSCQVALVAIGNLPALQRRRVLASYGSFMPVKFCFDAGEKEKQG